MIPMRSNLGRIISSGVTEAETEANRVKAEREAFHREGLVVISILDRSIPQTLRDMVEAIGRSRYGRRTAQQGRG